MWAAGRVRAASEQDTATYRSPFMEIAVSLKQPALVSLSIDSLGQAKFTQNALRLPKPSGNTYVVGHSAQNGLDVEYRGAGTDASAEPGWRITATDRTIRLTSRWSESRAARTDRA